MTYEVQTYDATDNTVYYETVEDVMSCEDARDVIAEKYPNRKVISVQEKNRGRMTEKYLLVERKPEFGFVEIRERNLKCFLLRFLIPISGLIDALISIFTLTLFTTNFRYVIAYRHTQEVALHEHEVLIRKLEDT